MTSGSQDPAELGRAHNPPRMLHRPLQLRRLFDRPVLLTIGFAALVHIWAAMSLPLVLTNDGFEYVRHAVDYLDGADPKLPPFRTPGYPLFLAATFHIGGIGPLPVLLAQHVLAVATCGLIALVAARFVRPIWAAAAGCAAALDPCLLTFSSYLLSETLSVFLFMLAVALALVRPRPPSSPARSIAIAMIAAAGAGVVIGMACLTRPSFQVVVPFVGLAAMLSTATTAAAAAANVRGRLMPMAIAGVVYLAGVAVPLAPWLHHNSGRGIRGLAAGTPVYFFHGISARGLLDESYPLPENVRASYEKHIKPHFVHYQAVYPFLIEHRAWYDPKMWELLDGWNKASIRARPGQYIVAALFTILWQLDRHPAVSEVMHSETRWFMQYQGAPGPTMIGRGDSIPEPPQRPFAAQRLPSPLARTLAWYSEHVPGGIPQIPLALLSMAATAICLLKRQWAVAVILAGTFAYVVAHAPLLLPFSRFSFAAWIAWYFGAAMIMCQPAKPSRPE